MATSLFDEPPSVASYQEYPIEKPFLNSNMRRKPGKPVAAYPESSSDAVLSALKGLQEKIFNLELDRSKAEKNLKSLAAETSAYKSMLASAHTSPARKVEKELPIPSVNIGKVHSPRFRVEGTGEVESQLRNADARCHLLERQLENMRRMVQSAERERSDALERQIALERDRGRVAAENRDIQNKLTKMEFIQNKFEDLATRKEKSEARIKELEEQLKREEHQKKLLSDKAAQLQTEAEANRILMKGTDNIPVRDDSQKKPIKKKKKRSSKTAEDPKKRNTLQPRKTKFVVKGSAGQPHYRLNLADVPFIAGTSTSPSHAVSANLQKLLHDLKQHSPLYCNDKVVCAEKPYANCCDTSSGSSSEEDIRRGRQREKRYSSTEEDLSDLLIALQDEFGKMTFEHQVLLKQVEETYDPEVKRDLECELQLLVSKMEKKGDQISTVRRHTMLLAKNKSEKQTRNMKKSNFARSLSNPRHIQSDKRFVQSASNSPRGRLGEKRQERMALLRDMRTVRSALRKDDLSWD